MSKSGANAQVSFGFDCVTAPEKSRRRKMARPRFTRSRGARCPAPGFEPQDEPGDGGPDRDQTDDLFVANEALYQLSYRPPKRVWYWKNPAGK